MKQLLILFLILTAGYSTTGQQKSSETGSGLCSRENALETIRQQIDLTRTIDDQVKRIAVLLRAADLLWPYQRDKARSAFTEAFDLARQNYKEKGDKPLREGHLIVDVPDQRYRVITTIAKRDAAWARKLTDQMLQEEVAEADDKTAKDPDKDARTAEKLLSTAYALLPSDPAASLTFATSSLRYPPTIWLPMFLYKLSELNRPGADALYRQALVAYGSAPMERFLYLSSYPFGNSTDVGEMPMTTGYAVPNNFVPSVQLQHEFVQALLRRAQQAIENPGDTTDTRRSFSDTQQTWFALTRLESQIEKTLPDLIEAVRQAKGNLFTTLNQKEQQRLGNTETSRGEPMDFEHLIEGAGRVKDPAQRDGMLAMAAISGAQSDKPLEQIISAIEKIEDRDVREKLLNWVYFERAQQATSDKKLDEAKRFAAKVAELDQRAYLYLKIAEASIKQTKSDTEARELLEEVVTIASKAPDTMVKARALLGVAYLYTNVEVNRSVSVLSEAVRSINRIDSPDFSSDDAGRRIEGKAFGAYATMKTPGFNPENGFREIGKYDFDGTFYLAGNFADKPLRAMTTLALAKLCLEQTQSAKSEKPRKPQRAPQTKP